MEETEDNTLADLRAILNNSGLLAQLPIADLASATRDCTTIDDIITAAFSVSSTPDDDGKARRNAVLVKIVNLGVVGEPLLHFLLQNDYAPIETPPTTTSGSPLVAACRVGNARAARFLLQRGRLADDVGDVLVRVAVESNRLAVVRLLVRQREVDLSALESHAYLDTACSVANVALARFLVRNGVKLVPSLVDRHRDFIGRLLFRFNDDDEDDDDDDDGLGTESIVVSNLTLDWKRLGLREIHGSWFGGAQAAAVTAMNLSENKLQTLPSEFFLRLTGLKDLDVSKNELRSLGDAIKNCETLSHLNVSQNQLASLPFAIFSLPNLTALRASRNQLYRLPESETDAWTCTKLKILDVSRNKLVRLPARYFEELRYLREINVSRNDLEELPFNWGSTILEIFKASHNRLDSFPLSHTSTWILQELDMSHNRLTEIAYSVTQASKLTVLTLNNNRIAQLPNPTFWKCASLQELDLSSNLLGTTMTTTTASTTTTINTLTTSATEVLLPVSPTYNKPPRKTVSLTSVDVVRKQAEANVVFPALFKNCLQRLFLNDNQLHVVPESVTTLTALTRLGLSGNPIQFLPNGLGRLTSCWDLELRGIDLVNVPSHVRPGSPQGSTKRLLAYLRAQLRQSVPYNRMKLMIVGLQNRGKTTLLARLRGETVSTDGPSVSTVGVKVDEWTLHNPGSTGRLKRASDYRKSVVLSTWDMAGQVVYYATHQCFISGNTLYLACFNLSLGEEGVDNLKPWLLNIQARAPESTVIVVGTFKDKFVGPDAEQRVDALLRRVHERYSVKGYPEIVAICAVSNVTGDGVAKLQQIIYDAAMRIQDKDTKEPLVHRLVPKSYVSLQSAVSTEAQRRRDAGLHAVLNEAEFTRVIEGIGDNDIHDEEEIHLAAKFLHEVGVLLHYDDQLRRLNALYFIDPTWLIDLLAQVVTVKEKQSFVQNGILARRNVPFILKGQRYPQEYITQYLQLLERFEIALSIDDEHLLVPSMLPEDRVYVPGVLESGKRRKCSADLWKRQSSIDGWEWVESEAETKKRKRMEEEELEESDEETKEDEREEREAEKFVARTSRYYVMSYIPSGFWSRLIVRLVVHLERAGLGRPFCIRSSSDSKRDVVSTSSSLDVAVEAVDDIDLADWSLETTSPRSTTVLWRTGAAVVHRCGQFEVQSFENDSFLRDRLAFKLGKSPDQLSGISVTVWTKGDFSALGYVVDQIDGLIEEWFPGLTEFDVYGSPLIQRLVPYFYSDPARPSVYNVHLFSLQDCATAVESGAGLICPATKKPVTLTDLVPELMLTDLPDKFRLVSSRLDFKPTKDNQIGSGGAGQVYRGHYDGRVVAIKRLTTAFSSDTPITNPAQLQMRGEEALRVLRELRQEATVLAHLRHPNIVPLLGISLKPLCFALELAPSGSLSGVLEAKANEIKKQDKSLNVEALLRGPVLGPQMTYRIAFQVVKALVYLHSQSIVYRDLKSDNILVWTLSAGETINIKLSDYGISRFSTTAGLKGEEGTPGFLAPEAIKKKDRDSAYDKQVDIFSYGMVLFELFTGTRPFAHVLNPQEINRLVYRGDRPELKKHMSYLGLPHLEEIMYKCWQGVSHNRPTALEILQKLNDFASLCLRHRLPRPKDGILAKIDCLFSRSPLPSSSSSSSSIQRSRSVNRRRPPTSLSSSSRWECPWLWAHTSDEDGRRVSKLSLLIPEMGNFKIRQMNTYGMRVLSAVYVDGCVWLAAERESCVTVYGWPLKGLVTRFGSIPVRQCILEFVTVMDEEESTRTGEPVVKSVIASTVNGSLYLFRRKMSFNALRSPLMSRPEKAVDAWELSTEKVIRQDYPSLALVLVRNQTELWGSFREEMHVVDSTTLEPKTRFAVFDSQRSFLTQLVADERCVYGIDRRAPFVFQWDIASRQLVSILNCSCMTARIGTNVQMPAYENVYVDMMKLVKKKEKFLHVDGRRQRRRPKAPSLGSIDAWFNLTEEFVESSASAPLDSWSMLRGRTRSGSLQENVASADGSVVVHSSTHKSREPQRVTSLLIVGDALWVARGMGDVLVLKRDVHGNGVTVLAGQLKMIDQPELYGHTSDQKLTYATGGYVISSQFLEPRNSPSTVPKVPKDSPLPHNASFDLPPSERSQQLLAVYSAWSASDFEAFDHFRQQHANAERSYVSK